VEKGSQAAARIANNGPRGNVGVQELDLSSLKSIRAAAAALIAKYPKIDLLINNAAVMHTPKSATKDGFELQFGTNHLGHFALTGLLLKQLLSVAGSRVVTVSSIAHRVGARIKFDALQSERSYDRLAAYAQSKLANRMAAMSTLNAFAGVRRRVRLINMRTEENLDPLPGVAIDQGFVLARIPIAAEFQLTDVRLIPENSVEGAAGKTGHGRPKDESVGRQSFRKAVECQIVVGKELENPANVRASRWIDFYDAAAIFAHVSISIGTPSHEPAFLNASCKTFSNVD
jgi:NAD(P)-dependent dehydrogenase (short-subunit alcohol dehydrogenase family)